MTIMNAKSLFYEALVKKYEAQIAEAKATLHTYFTASVGIGEHSDLLEEFDKHMDNLANAEDKLEKLQRHFGENPAVPHNGNGVMAGSNWYPLPIVLPSQSNIRMAIFLIITIYRLANKVRCRGRHIEQYKNGIVMRWGEHLEYGP